MGTRGAVGFRLDGRNVIYYNHFDSYPEALGDDVVQFCRDLMTMDLEQVKSNIRRVEFVDNNIPPTLEQLERYEKFTDLSVSSRSLTDWYCVLRKAQMAEGLYAIAKGELSHIIDSSDFIKDSLFCEYAYVIDLDKFVLEIYRGFQRKQQDGNPFGTEVGYTAHDGTKYYPCCLALVFPLDNIPDNWKEIFSEWDSIHEGETCS